MGLSPTQTGQRWTQSTLTAVILTALSLKVLALTVLVQLRLSRLVSVPTDLNGTAVFPWKHRYRPASALVR